MTRFQATRIEGGLLGPETLEELADGSLKGQRPQDFGLPPSHRLIDEIAAVFADARELWKIFQNRLERLPPEDLATSPTRSMWVIPFLGLLGYGLCHNARAYESDGLTFAISHRAGENEDAPPVHIVGIRQELGRVAPSGRPRLSPHALVQEYLNRSEAVWGLVTNGATLRILRDSTFVRRQAYVEFDLRAILEEQRFEEFALLFRLLHRSRLPQGQADAEACLLEQYYQDAIQQGGRVRERLREGVERCLEILAKGFLRHPQNNDLRAYIADHRITAETLYGQLLRLVYRLLFLLVCEDRGLLSADPLYRDHYSVGRLRRLLERPLALADREHEDLWCSLQVLWKLLHDDTPGPDGRPLAATLGLPVLNGELFAPLLLDACALANGDLLQAFWHLAYYCERPGEPPRPVNYAALDVEELGSVYESLLDLHPVLGFSGATPTFHFAAGTQRKTTGSYYTPPELVAELVRSTLEPVLTERLKNAKTPAEKEQAILSLRVLDPACGSGHFLLAAARRLGKELARLRTGEEEPPPEAVRLAVRDVVAHCIYGVDKNPLAVELCRVALWLETHCPDKPLTFLDHRIRCGDALVGILDLAVLNNGIPDEAFERSATDKQWAGQVKKSNRNERRALEVGQLSLPFDAMAQLQALGTQSQALAAIPDDTPQNIRQKAHHYQELQRKAERNRTACNLWTAAFFQELKKGQPAITSGQLAEYLEGRLLDARLLGLAEAWATEQHFFHWPLEFPEVFSPLPQGEGPGVRAIPQGEGPGVRAIPQGEGPGARASGFDVVLSNPPWERIKLQEQEFFSTRDADIATAPNAAARKKLIAALPQTNPTLWETYQHTLHAAESASRFLRGSGFYPLTGRGDINTYSVFAERIRTLLAPGGRAGVILPTGIATDATNQHFFADLVTSGTLASLFDFDNRAKLFPDVISLMKFCLLTIQKDGHKHEAQFAFFCHKPEDLRDPRKVLKLSLDNITRINPNTRTLPIFRTRQDAELTRAIYERVPVLVREGSGEGGVGKADSRHSSLNPWGVRFLRMFDMSNDSHVFRTRNELEGEGYRLVGNVFVGESGVGSGEWGKPDSRPPTPDSRYLPLYEAKMIWHYDHRYGTYDGVSDRSSTNLPTPDVAQHADPDFVAMPWYWVPAGDVQQRLGNWQRGWLLGFRNVCRSTDERTAIFSLLPRVGVGNSLPVMLLEQLPSAFYAALYGTLGSLVFDWVVRQKLAGVNMNFFYVQQFPVLPPDAYTAQDIAFIVPRVLELTYTAWDMAPFAADVWRELGSGEWRMGNGEWGKQMRKEIIRQWEACHGIGLGEFLSRFGGLEGSNEPGGDVLSPDRNLAQGGTLRDDRSDPSGRRLGSGEHRRGVRPGESWGIHTILAHLAGFLVKSWKPICFW